jgi:hypothetical protein
MIFPLRAMSALVAAANAEGELPTISVPALKRRFLECGDAHHGFARVYCDACRCRLPR